MKGFRIWEIQEDGIPKEVSSGEIPNIPSSYLRGFIEGVTNRLDIENKTYAIRIGKEGLK